MPRGWPICVFCLASAEGCADMTAAKCWVHDARGMEILSTQLLYQSKRWSRYQIGHDLVLEFKYYSLTSAVAVMTVHSPHYPWTLSEKTLDRAVVEMGGAPSKGGEASIGTPELTIVCQELNKD